VRYAFLIYGDTAQPPSPERFAAFQKFSEEVANKGVMRGGERLRPAAVATTVRLNNGKTLTTDGPYAETKEQLGGFYILECQDLDEAISYAAKIPAARDGAVEVRPIWEMGE
jgi:hypothetical protein